MPKQITLSVRESKQELKDFLKRTSKARFSPRVQMLLMIKTNTVSYYSQIALLLGVNRNTPFAWAQQYEAGGIEKLLTDDSGGNVASLITPEIHKKTEERLQDTRQPLTGYKELQQWVQSNFLPDVNYHTLNKYVKRTFKTSLKVGRKSHVKKDPVLVEDFKKTTPGLPTY